MPGIRLHHDTYKASVGKTLTYVIETGQPYKRGYYDCNECGKRHARKAVHLSLDHNGDTIVSKEVYANLRKKLKGMPTTYLEAAGLRVENEVESPPPLMVGAVALDKREIIELPLNRDEAPAPATAPGRTKYESRDRMEKVVVKRQPSKRKEK